MSNTKSIQAGERTQTAELSVEVIDRRLSDGSKVHSVVIRENGGMPFVELDAIDLLRACELRAAIRFAIQQNTNISLA